MRILDQEEAHCPRDTIPPSSPRPAHRQLTSPNPAQTQSSIPRLVPERFASFTPSYIQIESPEPTHTPSTTLPLNRPTHEQLSSPQPASAHLTSPNPPPSYLPPCHPFSIVHKLRQSLLTKKFVPKPIHIGPRYPPATKFWEKYLAGPKWFQRVETTFLFRGPDDGVPRFLLGLMSRVSQFSFSKLPASDWSTEIALAKLDTCIDELNVCLPYLQFESTWEGPYVAKSFVDIYHEIFDGTCPPPEFSDLDPVDDEELSLRRLDLDEWFMVFLDRCPLNGSTYERISAEFMRRRLWATPYRPVRRLWNPRPTVDALKSSPANPAQRGQDQSTLENDSEPQRGRSRKKRASSSQAQGRGKRGRQTRGDESVHRDSWAEEQSYPVAGSSKDGRISTPTMKLDVVKREDDVRPETTEVISTQGENQRPEHNNEEGTADIDMDIDIEDWEEISDTALDEVTTLIYEALYG